MAITLSQSLTAVTALTPVSFSASGGTSPYVFSVLPNGAGGFINPSTGMYTAPALVSSDPTKNFDTIRVTDAVSATQTTSLLVGTPLLLVCDILIKELNLTSDRVYIWDQKLNQPTDSELYIAVSMPSFQPFASTNVYVPSSGLDSVQSLNVRAIVDLDIISRGPAARDRKEEVVLALNSTYAIQQQDANSFSISRLSSGGPFNNLSPVDGAAIPYRYKLSFSMQYSFTKLKPAQYFDDFTDEIVTDN